MFSGRETNPEIANSLPGNFLQAAISWTGHTLLLEYKKKSFVPDMRFLGAKLAKTVHAAAAWSVITDAVGVPVG